METTKELIFKYLQCQQVDQNKSHDLLINLFSQLLVTDQEQQKLLNILKEA